jgi:hypothetical protein
MIYVNLFIIISICMNVNGLYNDQLIYLDPIQINEEFDSNNQIANLTKSLFDKLKLNDEEKEMYKLDNIQFDVSTADFKNQQDYFSLDLKKTRYNSIHIQQNIQTNSIIMLKTSPTSKKLDREYVCRVANLCPCESECKLILNFQAKLNKIDPIQLIDETNDNYLSLKLKQPIVLNDINDNKPFFYQKQIILDIDLDENNKDGNDLIKIPLKLAMDLDSTHKNQIQNYQLSHIKNNEDTISLIQIDYNDLNMAYLKQNENGLNIYLNSSHSVRQLYKLKQFELYKNVEDYSEETQDIFVEKFQLKAVDPNFDAKQDIQIRFKLNKLVKLNDSPTKSNINSYLLSPNSASFIFNKNFFNITLNSNEESSSFKINLNKPISYCMQSTITFNSNNLNTNINKTTIVKLYDFELNENNELEIKYNLDSQVETDLYNFKLIGSCRAITNRDLILNDVALLMLNIKIDKSTSSTSNNNKISMNVVSAINEIDINTSSLLNNNSNSEIVFKNLSSYSTSSLTNLTLAYLLIETKSLDKFRLDSEQYLLSNSPIWTKNKLFQINEMRNGLYAIKIKQEYYDLIKKSTYLKNTNKYMLRFLVDQGDIKYYKNISIKIPLELVNKLNNIETSKLTTISYSSTLIDDIFKSNKQQNSLPQINLFNSVIIITTACVILIIFGMACFIISLSLYISNKCRNDKKNKGKNDSIKTIMPINEAKSSISSASSTSSSSLIMTSSNSTQNVLDSNNIQVYEYQPSEQKTSSQSVDNNNFIKNLIKNTNGNVYTIATENIHSGSSSSSSNNISPVTTTTTSVSNSNIMNQKLLKKNDISPIHNQFGPLFDTNLNNQNHNNVYDWFIQNNSNNNNTNNNYLQSVDNQYRNEIYRNSHLIFKASMNKQITGHNDLNVYEARPVQINSPAGSASSQSNSNSLSNNSSLVGASNVTAIKIPIGGSNNISLSIENNNNHIKLSGIGGGGGQTSNV